MLLFLLIWGLIVREPWRHNLAWSAVGAGALFVVSVERSQSWPGSTWLSA
jgi:hypothetical protein